jgi:two-component system NtrC family sensor kinase
MNAISSLRLQRAERRVEILERLLAETNRELAITQEQAAAVHTYLVGLNNVIPGAMISVSSEGLITRTTRGVHELLGYGEFELSGRPLAQVWHDAGAVIRRCEDAGNAVVRAEAEWIAKDGEAVAVLLSAAAHRDPEGRLLSLVMVGLDLRERRRLELELRHAQKLEALGQLSAGFAHEINTPMQYIGDNLYFIRDSFRELLPLLQLAAAAPQQLQQLPAASGLAAALVQAAAAADLEFARERLPRAVDSALEGMERVSRIVEAMKAFSHPQTEMGPTDLNRCLADTLTVARNEYKYVAEVQTEFGELPAVTCNGSDLNQVFLNLIVNAAHAIEERFGDSSRQGLIRVRTVCEDGRARITIGDNGTGIPEAIRRRVFDPFFTTKEVGKGTGQGLAISRSIVVERHGGSLSFDTEPGVGTTFHVCIPVEGPAPKETA